MIPLWAFGAALAALFGWGLYEHSKCEEGREKVVPLGPREYRVYLCSQAAGKTYQLKRAAELFAARGITVHVCDQGAEYGDIGTVFRSFEEYEKWTKEHGVPNICVHQLGEDVERYEYVFLEAIAECEPDSDSTTCVLIDEAYEFAPAGSYWRGSKTLRRIVRAGRHQYNVEGTSGCIHLLIASQRPQDIHVSLWQQANAIALGHTTGENFYRWARGNWGEDVADRAAKLKPREWMWALGDPASLRTASGQLKRDSESKWFREIRPSFD